MRKLHQSEIPDPLVSEGECIEYTTIDDRVFHVLAVENDNPGTCPGCIFYQFKNDRSAVSAGRYICDCGLRGEHSLCYKGTHGELRRSYCKFVDMDSIMENL